ncbi:MAG: hypothetical protein A2020_07360 [Lentisphaerae bacterium GWF2_45_14]|nr:MAG: hypothetical protein A2020_07360 [Lentisphaerae bacterium GWF2_45_14]
MKIAVIAPLMQSPAGGGAVTDIFETFGIIARTNELLILSARFLSSPFGRGVFKEKPQLNVNIIDFETLPDRETFIGRLLDETAKFAPDAVVIADAWTTKPYLITEFRKHWPVVVRVYAEELLCPRNNQRWLNAHLCDSSTIENPNSCVDCARQYRDFIYNLRNGADNPLTEEMRVADIFRNDYPATISAALRGLHAIVSNSEMKSLLSSAGAARVSIVPLGVDTDFFSPSSDRRDRSKGNHFRILLAGRMDDKSKGFKTTLDACNILAEKGLKFELLATASTMPDPAMPVPPWLNLLGWLGRGEIRDLMRNSDCALVPSLCREAFGLAWAEAMAVHLPVIASDTPGPLEYITHGVDGLIFPKGDVAALADSIEKLMTDDALRKRIADAGFHMVTSKLKWSVSAAETLKAIKTAVAESSIIT